MNISHKSLSNIFLILTSIVILKGYLYLVSGFDYKAIAVAIVYMAVFLLVVFGIMSLYRLNKTTDQRFFIILFINVITHLLWATVEIVFAKDIIYTNLEESLYFAFNISILSIVIYYFLYVNVKQIEKLIVFVTICVSFSVCYDFLVTNNILINNPIITHHYLNTIVGGMTDAIMGVTMTGNAEDGHVYRVSGIFPDNHYSGNVAALLSIYWFSILLISKIKVDILFLMIISICTLFFSGSATNIIAFSIAAIIVFIYRFVSYKSHNTQFNLSIILITILSAAFLVDQFIVNPFTSWINKVNSNGDWGAMTEVVFDKSSDGIFYLIAGHGHTIGSEHAITGMISKSGIFLFAIEMTFLIYPIYKWLLANRVNKINTLPAVSAILVGILSLAHYGTVLSITNILMFYIFYSIVLRPQYFNLYRKKMTASPY